MKRWKVKELRKKERGREVRRTKEEDGILRREFVRGEKI